ncbi:MAG: lipopolysaccharide biosynthesis protein [Alphaproteobacteria bacterium]|nr:lipopolysaccharide biosynthesis protein [Alphaproteobacteria bacterium]
MVMKSRSLKGLFSKNEFAKNVLTLMSGTLIAQLLPILASPLLTRLYSPTEFGLLGAYLAMVAVCASVASGKYDQAIIMTPNESETNNLLMLSLLLPVLFSFFLFVAILVFYQEIVGLSSDLDNMIWLYYVPIGVILACSYASIITWFNRFQKYKEMAQNKALQAGSITFLQILFGYFTKISLGLIFADAIGRFITTLDLLRRYKTNHSFEFNWHEKIKLIKKYKKFPLYEAPASLFNIAALQAPLFLIPIYFSPVIAGAYFLVFRVVMAPISLVGESMMQVFREKATKDFYETGSCRRLFVKTMWLMFAIGIIPTLVLMSWGREIFAVIFGENWENAGLYAQIFAPLALIRLISGPLGYLFILREKLMWDMLLQGLFLLMTVSAIVVGGINNDVEQMISYISLSGIIFYSCQIGFSFYLSKNNE